MANRFTYGNAEPTNGIDPDGHLVPAVVPAIPLIVTGLEAVWAFGTGLVIGTTAGVVAGTAINSGGGSVSAPGPTVTYGPPVPLPGSSRPGLPDLSNCAYCTSSGGNPGAGPGGVVVAPAPPPPPPPPPGIQARIDSEAKAKRAPLPIPADALADVILDVVSSDPDVPAGAVEVTTNNPQQFTDVYRKIKNKIVDPKKPIIKNAKRDVASELVSGVDVGALGLPPSSTLVFTDGNCTITGTWRSLDGYTYNRSATYSDCGGAAGAVGSTGSVGGVGSAFHAVWGLPAVGGTIPRLAIAKSEREAPNMPGIDILSRLALPGEEFNMVLSKGQPNSKPGGFGTFDEVRSQNYARHGLAIRTDWKADVSLLQRYRIPDGEPIRIQESIVGRQRDPVLGWLAGGDTQLEILKYEDRARLIPIGDPIELP